jgi:FtsP/CotA-like multicopper oxidase with cupredoxin domain
LYSVNAIPFHYLTRPSAVNMEALIRNFLVNIPEYDPINSFHLHVHLLHDYPTGTSRTPAKYTDTVAQMQGQRGLLELRYRYPGRHLFHAHKTEFAALGWSGLVQVVEWRRWR